jgi:hypothetical protein
VQWAAWLLSLALVFFETVLFSFLLAQIFLDHARIRIYAYTLLFCFTLILAVAQSCAWYVCVCVYVLIERCSS